MVKPRAMPRGMIVTLCTGSECGSMAATSACPASWYAVFFFSSSESRSDLRSTPISTLSFATSKSYIRTALRFCRAAASARFVHHVGQVRAGESRSAASEHRQIDIVGERNLAGVHTQNFFASANIGTIHHHAPVETARAQQRRIKHIGRLVAAIRMTPSFDSKPSISTSNWFKVCSRSSCPPPRPAPR